MIRRPPHRTSRWSRPESACLSATTCTSPVVSRRLSSSVRWLHSWVNLVNLPPEIAAEIREKLERARKLYPSSLSRDGNAVMLHGSIGYGCYFSPDGDIFIEEYDIGSDEAPTIDRSRLAEIGALVLTSRYMPKLGELLPKRPETAASCEEFIIKI